MSTMEHFPNFSYIGANFKIELNLDRFAKQFADAQQWLGDRVLEDCKPFMPHLTGSQQQRSYVESSGRKVIFPGPYARFLYMGKVMVDPDTGSPWARKGVQKVVTERPLTYSSPSATDHWFDTAKAQYGEYWVEGIKRRAGGR